MPKPSFLVRDLDTIWDKYLKCRLYRYGDKDGPSQGYLRKSDILEMAEGLFPELIDQIPPHWVKELSPDSKKQRGKMMEWS